MGIRDADQRFDTVNRYRDLALSPDTRTVYIATDASGFTRDAEGLGATSPSVRFQSRRASDWARRFNEAAQPTLTQTPSQAPALQSHDDYLRSAPTPEHFIPMLYIAGLAGAANRPLETLVDGYAYGSLSMAAYTLDAKCPIDHGDTRPAATLPDPAVIAPEDTNL